jgi:adenosylhomocysteine nucleosidase
MQEEGRVEIGIVTGLTAEAKIARALSPRVMAGGGGAAGARLAAQKLLDRGATALLSFGVAGGLAPHLRAGDLAIPAAVVTQAGRFAADPALLARFGGATIATLLGGDEIAVTAAAKSALYKTHGAAAIDLESGAVAEEAARAGLPFAVLRAICDPAGRDLPPAAIAALDRAGAIGFFRVARSILAGPAQLPALMALGRDAAAARRALVRIAAYPDCAKN